MKYAGLTKEQVEQSRREHGSNALTDLPPESLWFVILKGFKNPMIIILLVAPAIQLILLAFRQVEWYEALGTPVAILAANGVAAFFENRQAWKASQLKHEESSKEKAKVVRDGVISEIPVSDVVVGDIVFLQAGDKIPADGILLDGTLKVDQASLNGESEEAPKEALVGNADYNINDLLNSYYVYRGTVICSGEAYEKVLVNGDRTIYGQSALAAKEAPPETPLQVKLGRLAQQISLFGYIGAAVIIITILATDVLGGNAPAGWMGWLRLVVTAVTTAVTIIVCAVPEGLPMLRSILQALQSPKMEKDNVLVRKINGLETSGSLSILFCDKTGTITMGRLSVVEFATGDSVSFDALSKVSEKLQADMICGIGVNNSSQVGGGSVVGGNNTDRALMEFLLSNGVAKRISKDGLVAFNPFDSNKKCSSVVIDGKDGRRVFVKGAPERILERCGKYVAADGTEKPFEEKAALARYLDEQANRSMRLLAVAKADGEDEQAALTLVCILSIRDNVRREVGAAVDEIHAAGIQVVMVTGDRRETAVAIAREAGLLSSSDDIAITSFEMSEMSDDELKAILPRLRVVSRALPLDKSRLVRVAQEMKLVVGMTGDGVNDSPALGKADVGFAMGSGTEVAKEAGDITILDDNLTSIEKGILYGRTMFKCIRKFLIFQLSVNVAAVFVCAIAPIFGMEQPMTVVQLLMINLAMDTLAAIAYGSEPPLMEYMHEKPIPRDESIVTKEMYTEVAVSGIYITVLCLALLFWTPLRNFVCASGDESYLKSTLFATFMMAITFNGFNARTTHLNPFEGLGRNMTFVTIMALILAFQYLFVTFGGKTLAVTPLTCDTWLKSLVLALLVIPVDIIRKLLSRRI
ncbi:MAG: calcium-translocating P-type ATPase, PMCA-type [Lentisphaeria bacterium]|nr:calcium-translocating P-type ATPase, PMCA-type [Lentisphaeria bacterium]